MFRRGTGESPATDNAIGGKHHEDQCTRMGGRDHRPDPERLCGPESGAHAGIARQSGGGGSDSGSAAGGDLRRDQWRAELKVEPYRNALHDFDFQALLRREVERAVADLTWLDTVTVEVDRSPEGKLRQDRLANGTSDSIFVLRVGYSMTPDFGSLHVTGDAKILPTKAGEARRQKDAAKPKATAATAASGKPSQPLYWQTFTATQSTPADSPGPAGEVWTRNNGAALRAALEAATRNLVDQVAEDVDGRRAANKPK